jgi:8-oxo-dGTP pyrophosphatase MutT (NUDIX family)
LAVEFGKLLLSTAIRRWTSFAKIMLCDLHKQLISSSSHFLGTSIVRHHILQVRAVYSAGDNVLVLLRNSTHNYNTWGIPGGNADIEDAANLLQTAKREAIEEMGHLPDLEVKGQVCFSWNINL